MLMVGEARVLLSHLPMFHAPHDQQIILEASLSAPGFDPRKQYVDDRNATQTMIYTWVPKPFVLSDLLGSASGDHHGRNHLPRSFRARGSCHHRRTTSRPGSSAYCTAAGSFVGSAARRAPLGDVRRSVRIIPGARDHKAARLRSGYGHRDRAPLPRLAGWEGVGITLKIDASSPDTALREGDQVSATRLDGPATGSAVLTVRREFYLETSDLAS